MTEESGTCWPDLYRLSWIRKKSLPELSEEKEFIIAQTSSTEDKGLSDIESDKLCGLAKC